MSQIKNEIKIIKEKICSLLVLGLVFVMLFSSLSVGLAANQDTTNLAVNIVAGALEVTAPTGFNWADVTAGLASNQSGNLNNVLAADYRGNATVWGLTATANNLNATGGNLNTYARVKVSPGNITNINGSNISSVTAGSANQALGPDAGNAVNMMSGDTGAAGAYQLDNTVMNFHVEAADAAGDYTAVLTLTIN